MVIFYAEFWRSKLSDFELCLIAQVLKMGTMSTNKPKAVGVRLYDSLLLAARGSSFLVHDHHASAGSVVKIV